MSINANFGYNRTPISAWFSYDGKRLVVPNSSGVVEVRDSETGNVLRELKADSGEVVSVAIAPDGRQIAGGVNYRDAHVVYIWDTEDGA